MERLFLSDEFLAGETTARGIVLQMMKLYEEHGCEILIEAPGVRTSNDWSVVESLLKERDDKIAASGANVKPEKQRSNAAAKDASPAKKRKATEVAADTSSEPAASGIGIPKSTLTPQQLAKPAIVLFHSHDCRLHDNVALQLASHHACVIPLFIWSRKEQGRWGVRGCMEVILKDALRNLDEKLRSHGLELTCRQGDDSSEVLRQLCEECGSSAVYYNVEHTPESRVREAKYRRLLGEIDVETVECQSSLLYDPTSPQLGTGFHGGHWGTLMPFLKGCKKQLGEPRKPVQRFETFAMLEAMAGPVTWPSSSSIDGLDLAVIEGILERFPMSEDAAHSNLEQFFKVGFGRYESDRSRADLEWSTSKLSAHLRVGTLSPNVLYYKTEASELDYPQRKTFSRRLFWRDLAYFHLQSFPGMRWESIRLHYGQTEWCNGEEGDRRFLAWKRGQTGFPLVDAGMRELYKTGWMTQSIRMVVASFLTEYLRVDWRMGAEWFHYTLADADSAINPMMWQNAGRSGIDQWNFVMSPVAASQDASGEYTRRWVPELAKLPRGTLHKPWETPAQVLNECGIVLGRDYPHRIVTDLKAERALSDEAVLEMRRKNQQFNNERGYDLVQLPNGKETVVFTKKQFRIDRQGIVLKETKKTTGSGAAGRGRRGQRARKKAGRDKVAGKR